MSAVEEETLENWVRMFRRHYDGGEVAYHENGHEAWLLSGDILISIRDDGNVSFRLFGADSTDWLPVEFPISATPQLAKDEDGRAHRLTPTLISIIRSWARAKGMQLPTEGLESLTPEIVTAYFAEKGH